MKYDILVLCSVLCMVSCSPGTERADTYSQRMVESVALQTFLSNQKEQTLATADWDYVPGLVAYSVLNAWLQYPEKTEYYDAVKAFADHNIQEGDTVIAGASNLDDLAAGKIFFQLYLTELEKGNTQDAHRYRNCADFLRNKLKYTHARIDGSKPGTGGFFHKAQYPNQMWLDGLYMGTAFYAGWQNAFGQEAGTQDNEESWADIVLQFTTIHTYTRDGNKKLNYHAWSADPADANSFWARRSDPLWVPPPNSGAAAWGGFLPPLSTCLRSYRGSTPVMPYCSIW